MMRNFPPKGTEGLARQRVSCLSREPRPPASISARVSRVRRLMKRPEWSICIGMAPCLGPPTAHGYGTAPEADKARFRVLNKCVRKAFSRVCAGSCGQGRALVCMAARALSLCASEPGPGRLRRPSPAESPDPGRNGRALPVEAVPDPVAGVLNGPGKHAESGLVGFKGCMIVPLK